MFRNDDRILDEMMEEDLGMNYGGYCRNSCMCRECCCRGPRGPRGPEGPEGPQGPQGTSIYPQRPESPETRDSYDYSNPP